MGVSSSCESSPARGRATRALEPRPPASSTILSLGGGTGRGDQSSSGSWSIRHLLPACGWSHRHQSASEGEGPQGGRAARPRPRRDLGARSCLCGSRVQDRAQARLPCPISIFGTRVGGHASDSIPEPPEERPQVQTLPQQGGACGAAAALAGQGRGCGAPLTAQASLQSGPHRPARQPSATRWHWGGSRLDHGPPACPAWVSVSCS